MSRDVAAQVIPAASRARIDSALAHSPWAKIGQIVPARYGAIRTNLPVIIDGRLDDEAWSNATWSREFVDITGSSERAPWHSTRMKIIWDDEFLYIGAELEEPDIWGKLTEKNSVIFNDDDFEIFIDPNGDRHNYYELEINALNTIWELRLIRSYRDGGPVVNQANLPGLKSAVAFSGTLNDPSDRDSGWSVEVGLPWSDLDSYRMKSGAPSAGETWRMNFSRVEHHFSTEDNQYIKIPDQPAENWVWSPQGLVDMHVPERWGFITFVSDNMGTGPETPGFRPGAEVLMEVYHAQKIYRGIAGYFASTLDELKISAVGEGLVLAIIVSGDRFLATIRDAEDSNQIVLLQVNQRGRLWRPN